MLFSTESSNNRHTGKDFSCYQVQMCIRDSCKAADCFYQKSHILFNQVFYILYTDFLFLPHDNSFSVFLPYIFLTILSQKINAVNTSHAKNCLYDLIASFFMKLYLINNLKRLCQNIFCLLYTSGVWIP